MPAYVELIFFLFSAIMLLSFYHPGLPLKFFFLLFFLLAQSVISFSFPFLTFLFPVTFIYLSPYILLIPSLLYISLSTSFLFSTLLLIFSLLHLCLFSSLLSSILHLSSPLFFSFSTLFRSSLLFFTLLHSSFLFSSILYTSILFSILLLLFSFISKARLQHLKDANENEKKLLENQVSTEHELLINHMDRSRQIIFFPFLYFSSNLSIDFFV